MPYTKLRQNVDAWNVDGSCTDQLFQQSWINFWETTTRQQRGICGFADCYQKATVGGHVWIKRRGVHIVPICHKCNYCENANRMQNTQGCHSQLRAGAIVVPLQPSKQMLTCKRRFSTCVRLCENCNANIDDKPTSHTLCYQCFKQKNKQTFKRCSSTSVRVCKNCNANIDNKPMSHTLCYQCFSQNKHTTQNTFDSSDDSCDDSSDDSCDDS